MKKLKELDKLIKKWEVPGYESDLVDDLEEYIKDLIEPKDY